MRWIAVGLWVITVALFVWGKSNPRPMDLRESVRLAPAGTPELVLLDTLPVSTSMDRVTEALAVSMPEVVPEVALWCWLLGPVMDPVSVRQMRTRLQSMGVDGESLVFERPGNSDYWVHIPPLPSRREALALLRELQSKGIDSFLITEGELANGVSLGFFSRQSSAERIREERHGQGYEVVIREVMRYEREYLVGFSSATRPGLSDELLEQVTQGFEQAGLRESDCEELATAKRLP